MGPHYYIMRHRKILRLEEEVQFSNLPEHVKINILDDDELVSLDQDKANWRVAIFRDEIMDLEEYQEWLLSSEAKNLEQEMIDEYVSDS
jgi:hypothetical protein